MIDQSANHTLSLCLLMCFPSPAHPSSCFMLDGYCRWTHTSDQCRFSCVNLFLLPWYKMYYVFSCSTILFLFQWLHWSSFPWFPYDRIGFPIHGITHCALVVTPSPLSVNYDQCLHCLYTYLVLTFLHSHPCIGSFCIPRLIWVSRLC